MTNDIQIACRRMAKQIWSQVEPEMLVLTEDDLTLIILNHTAPTLMCSERLWRLNMRCPAISGREQTTRYRGQGREE